MSNQPTNQPNIIQFLQSKGCLLGGNGDEVKLKLPFSFEPPIRFYRGIGQHCKIGAFTSSNSALEFVNFGRYCSIARGVVVLGDHPIDWLTTNYVTYGGPGNFTIPGEKPYEVHERFVYIKPVILGNDVWIGDGVKFKNGITIGTGAIVGANAVVTKDIPPYAIVGGVPAKIIRYRFDEKIIAALLESKWWEFNITEIKLNVRTPIQAIEQLKEAEAKGLIKKYQPRWTNLKAE